MSGIDVQSLLDTVLTDRSKEHGCILYLKFMDEYSLNVSAREWNITIRVCYIDPNGYAQDIFISKVYLGAPDLLAAFSVELSRALKIILECVEETLEEAESEREYINNSLGKLK